MKFSTWAWIAPAALVLCASAGAQESDSEADSAAPSEPQPEQQEREVRRLGDMINEGGEDFSMDIPVLDMPQAPVEAQPEVTLPDPAMDDQLQNILARRAFVPDNPEIEQELTELLDQVEALAGEALAAGDFELATRYANVLAELEPQRGIIAEIEAERERLEEVQRLLGLADQALESGNLLEPADGSAWTLYGQVLELDPENEPATAGRAAVREQLLARFDELLGDSDFEASTALLDRLEALEFDADVVAARRAQVAEARADQRRSMISAARAAIDSEDFDAAEDRINDLIAFGADEQTVAQLRRSLEDAQRYAGFEPGQLFQDGIGDSEQFGPVMIVIPSGSFMMGSPDNEDDRVDNEGPRFRVTFDRGFALARNETTVAEFRTFVEATGYVTDAERRGASRIYVASTGSIASRDDITWRDDYKGDPAADNLPVVHVSFNDAQAYADWLTGQTDRPYRLPSEAEFEYALRGGTQTRYWWGDDRPRDPLENVTGDGDRFGEGRSWESAFRRYSDGFWGPAPVASLQANPFGLFDMGGNVMEWVQDCWHDSYVRAPDDGSAWLNPGCDRRVIRGAQWSSTPEMSRAAFRLSASSDTADARVGFRVARDL